MLLAASSPLLSALSCDRSEELCSRFTSLGLHFRLLPSQTLPSRVGPDTPEGLPDFDASSKPSTITTRTKKRPRLPRAGTPGQQNMSERPAHSGAGRYEQSPSRYDAPPSRPGMPGAHPDSVFAQPRANRRSSRDGLPPNSSRTPYLAARTAPIGPKATTEPAVPPSYVQAAIPPEMQGYWTPETNYYNQQDDNITASESVSIELASVKSCLLDLGRLLTFQ